MMKPVCPEDIVACSWLYTQGVKFNYFTYRKIHFNFQGMFFDSVFNTPAYGTILFFQKVFKEKIWSLQEILKALFKDIV